MESRTRNYGGRQTTTYYYHGNVVGVPFEDTQPSGYDSLTVVSGGNVKGNRKSPNPIQFHRDDFRHLSGFYSVKYPDDLEQVTSGDGIGNAYSTGAGFSDLAYEEALGKLYDSWRNSADWSVNLLQGGQTARMFRDAIGIVNYVRKFRRQQLPFLYQEFLRWKRSGGRTSKLAADKWLEFQYGWKPLAQDIYNTASELTKIYPPLMVVEGKSSKSTTVEIDRPTILPYLREVGTAIISQRCYIKCRFRPPASDAQLLSNFTSMNPASIAWELIPFSFCVDWVYDVGGYLRNLESSMLSHASFVDGFVTEGSKVDASTRVNGSKSVGGYTYAASMSGSCHRTQKRRTVLSEQPFPRPPVFKLDLGATRLANAAALIAQQFHRR